MSAMRVSPVAGVLVSALVVGALAFYVDLHSDEVQPAAFILFAGSAVIGFAQPKWSWLAGVVSGLCILGGHVANRASGGAPTFPIEPNPYGALVAVIPATVGALVGAGMRVMMRTGAVRR